MSVTDVDKGYARLIEELGDLGEPYVLVGIRQQEGEKIEEGEELNLATIAVINEFGAGPIPSRPFLRSTVDEKREAYVKALADAVVDVIDWKANDVEQGLTKLGIKAVSDVQRKIRHNDFQPNAESTKRAKDSSKPLIDTGRLRQSIDFETGGT